MKNNYKSKLIKDKLRAFGPRRRTERQDQVDKSTHSSAGPSRSAAPISSSVAAGTRLPPEFDNLGA